jgi:FlaA1/EpsC-like NDP-sugar epimerase
MLRIIQIIIDFLLIILSFSLAYFLRVGFVFSTDFPFETYAVVFIPTSIVWIGILLFQNVYTHTPISKRRLFTSIISANLIGITLFVLIFFYKRDIFFSRLILVYVWTLSNIFIISNAWIFRIIKFHLHSQGIGTKKTLIVGANKTAEEAIKNCQKFEPYYEVVAILDAYGTKKKAIYGISVLGKMNSLEEVIQEKNIQVIIQADCIEQSLNLIHISEKNNINYFLMPQLLGMYHKEAKLKTIGKKAMIIIENNI